MGDEIVLELRRFAVIAGGIRPLAHDPRPFAVEIDQILRHRLPFGGIAAEQVGRRLPAQHQSQLPAEVEGIAHRHVHPLSGLRAVGVAGIAADEDMGQAVLALGHIVELVGQALPDLVDRPPGGFPDLETIGPEDPLRRRDQLIQLDIAIGHALIPVELVEFDIKPGQIAAFARDDDDIAFLRRLDQRLAADIGEIRLAKHIHHPPGLIGAVADQLPTDGAADIAARAVAADDIFRPQLNGLALMLGIAAFQRDIHGIFGTGLNGQVGQLQRIIGFQPRGRVAHHLQIHVMHAGLIEDDMRHFRQPVLDILDAAVAGQVFGPLRIGLPEGGLVDPVALLEHLPGEAEGVEHLHRAAGNAVGLTLLHRAGAAFDDAGGDLGEG